MIGEGSPFALWTNATAARAMRTVAILADSAVPRARRGRRGGGGRSGDTLRVHFSAGLSPVLIPLFAAGPGRARLLLSAQPPVFAANPPRSHRLLPSASAAAASMICRTAHSSACRIGNNSVLQTRSKAGPQRIPSPVVRRWNSDLPQVRDLPSRVRQQFAPTIEQHQPGWGGVPPHGQCLCPVFILD